MCDGHVEGAVLYETDGPTLGQWDAPARVEGFATWSLSEPGDWVAVRTYRAPTGDAEYSLYGGNSDSSASSSHVTFHRRDLSDLTERDQRVYFYPHRLDSSTGGTSWACDLSSITTSVWQSAAVTRLMVRCGDDSGSKAATRSSSSW